MSQDKRDQVTPSAGTEAIRGEEQTAETKDAEEDEGD